MTKCTSGTLGPGSARNRTGAGAIRRVRRSGAPAQRTPSGMQRLGDGERLLRASAATPAATATPGAAAGVEPPSAAVVPPVLAGTISLRPTIDQGP